MRSIESTLREGVTSALHSKHNKEEVERHVRDIQRILSTLYTLDAPLREGSSLNGCAPHSTSVDSCNSTTIAVSESGTSPSSASVDLA